MWARATRSGGGGGGLHDDNRNRNGERARLWPQSRVFARDFAPLQSGAAPLFRPTSELRPLATSNSIPTGRDGGGPQQQSESASAVLLITEPTRDAAEERLRHARNESPTPTITGGRGTMDSQLAAPFRRRLMLEFCGRRKVKGNESGRQLQWRPSRMQTRQNRRYILHWSASSRVASRRAARHCVAAVF